MCLLKPFFRLCEMDDFLVKGLSSNSNSPRLERCDMTGSSVGGCGDVPLLLCLLLSPLCCCSAAEAGPKVLFPSSSSCCCCDFGARVFEGCRGDDMLDRCVCVCVCGCGGEGVERGVL